MKFNVLSSTLSVTFSICLSASLLVMSNFAIAQTTPKTVTKHSSTKKTTKVAAKASTTPLVITSTTDDENAVPDLKKCTTQEYKCELNDSLTLYTHKEDDSRAALRWKNKLYGLKRIQTTTGANRFENKKAGLVWIGIPTKAMLFDSHLGQQLANECKTANQAKSF